MTQRRRSRNARLGLRRNAQTHPLAVLNGDAGHGGLLNLYVLKLYRDISAFLNLSASLKRMFMKEGQDHARTCLQGQARQSLTIVASVTTPELFRRITSHSLSIEKRPRSAPRL
jgi:hypothetical protein